MPKAITPSQEERYWKFRSRGFSQTQAAKEAGFSRTHAWKLEKDLPTSSGTLLQKMREGTGADVPAPIPHDELNEVALRCLEDFGYFRRVVLGHWSEPWQERAAEAVVEYLEGADKDYVVENMPPGSGKTTLFTHDIPAWCIARDRGIRILIGSRVRSTAESMTRRLKRTLERKKPIEGAEFSMAELFGRFKPEAQDLWRSEELLVEQFEAVAPGEKEATVTAAGQDTGFLGGRYDLCIWDDLVSRKNSRTAEMREELQEWWKLEAETRLEPAGVLFLVGQRIATDDLYRYCLDMVAFNDDDDGERFHKYKHLKFPAHFEEECEGQHDRKSAKAWPEGCLLSPSRLPWRELVSLRENDPTRFEITMQQEDVDPAGQLVQDVWLEGGTGADGTMYVGCYDHERSIGQLPGSLVGPILSVATVDPSPENWWSIQWWCYDVESQQRFLMDHARSKMSAPDLLDRLQGGEYVGLADEWQRRSVDKGWPISHWIVERAAAQRFMYQYDFWQKWLIRHGVNLLPHDTTSNKADEDYGVQSIAPHYKYGRVRLPYAPGFGRRATEALTRELTRWPEGATDDCVMANWFFEYHLQNLVYEVAAPPQRQVPSWMRKKFERRVA